MDLPLDVAADELKSGQRRITENEELKRESLGRKRAEEAVRASERGLAQIINAIPALAWSARPDGSADFFNQHCLDYLGLSAEQARGWGWAIAVHPDDLNGLVASSKAMMASGRPGESEARLRRSDGEYRWFLFRASPLRDEEGHIVKWYGINTDIEDRKQAETQLAGEKRLLEMSASGGPLRHVLTALCSFVEAITPDCYCGVYPIDWSGPTFHSGVAPSLPASYTDPLEGLPVSGDVAPCGIAAFEKIQVIAADIESDQRWPAYRTHVLTHGLRSVWSTPICSLEGRRVLGTFCIYQRKPATPSPRQQEIIAHMTHIASIAIERSQADAALRRSETLLADGQRLSLTGTFSWRLDSDDIIFSEQLYRIFELDPDVPVTLGQVGARIHPEDLPLFSEAMERARSGGGHLDYEMRLRMPDDRVKCLRSFFHMIRHQDGRMECLGAVQDVTHHRLADEALDKARSELAHVTRVMSLGTITASIAHEVNQPLSGIITNASTCLRMLAAEPPNVDGARETARRTIRDGNRASEVIARLRALFTKKEVSVESIDLNEATREVIALSLNQLQRNRVIVRQELADALPPVTGDRVQLQQVILNLLLNASEAMSEIDDRPRELLVRTAGRDDDQVLVAVRDSGVGFQSQDVEKLFAAFYTTKSGGMGIGLSISRSILEDHGGRLWAEPNDGPGATFQFTLSQHR